MKNKFRKVLAVVLSLAIVIGCFSAIPFSAFAEGPSLSFTDFEDGVSPFYNNKTNAKKV